MIADPDWQPTASMLFQDPFVFWCYALTGAIGFLIGIYAFISMLRTKEEFPDDTSPPINNDTNIWRSGL